MTTPELKMLICEYPDTPLRRKILTALGDLEEMLNGHLYSLASQQGYVFDEYRIGTGKRKAQKPKPVKNGGDGGTNG
jgi:hypothetical protein